MYFRSLVLISSEEDIHSCSPVSIFAHEDIYSRSYFSFSSFPTHFRRKIFQTKTGLYIM